MYSNLHNLFFYNRTFFGIYNIMRVHTHTTRIPHAYPYTRKHTHTQNKNIPVVGNRFVVNKRMPNRRRKIGNLLLENARGILDVPVSSKTSSILENAQHKRTKQTHKDTNAQHKRTTQDILIRVRFVPILYLFLSFANPTVRLSNPDVRRLVSLFCEDNVARTGFGCRSRTGIGCR